MSANRISGITPRSYVFLVLPLLLVAGLCLRLVYLSTISLHVDEFISLLAIRGIHQHGYPLLPSGTLYEQGLLFSYAEALLLRVFGFDAAIGRAFSVVLSLMTIALVYYLGSRLFSSRVGLVAAALAALSPAAIAWGARVRMYSLLELLVLLTIWFLWRGGAEQNGARYRWMAVLCYLGALFTHPVSVLLFVPLVLGLTLLRGWRGMLRPRLIPELVVALAGMLATLLLKAVGQPGQLEALAQSRPYLAPSLNFIESWRPVAPFFVGTARLPLTCLAVLGLLVAAALALSARGRASAGLEQRRPRAALFLYTILGVTLLEMIFLVGPTWRDVRYLFMVEPLLFLTASWAAVVVADWFLKKVHGLMPDQWRGRFGVERLSWVVTSLLVVAAVLLFLPAARATVAEQEWGYDLAFEFLQERWQEGDAVLTIVPFACELYVPQCDYYASGVGYEEYVFDKSGVLIDRWIGVPLLTSASELESVLEDSSRTWLVVDGWRLAARFDLEFIRTVAEQMDVVHEVQGVRVLLAEGYRPVSEPVIAGSLTGNFGNQIELVGYELSGEELQRASDLHVTLYWQALRPVLEEYTVFAHLRGPDGSLLSQDDYPPLENLYPTYYWSEGQTVPDPRVLPIPADAAPGRYRLEVGFYGGSETGRLPVVDESGSVVGDSVIVDYVQVGELEAQTPSDQIGANLGNQVQLIGHDGVPSEIEAGMAVPLSLYWQALAEMDEDYTIFVHLLDNEGRMIGQHDGQPEQGFYPTSSWDIGETVRDEVEVSVDPSAPAGEYRLVAGLYLSSTGERLPALDENGRPISDWVLLGNVTVVEG
jgi:4-amino-4-deoxy-L-arabinose transferase-like glycosyltransferase